MFFYVKQNYEKITVCTIPNDCFFYGYKNKCIFLIL